MFCKYLGKSDIPICSEVEDKLMYIINDWYLISFLYNWNKNEDLECWIKVTY